MTTTEIVIFKFFTHKPTQVNGQHVVVVVVVVVVVRASYRPRGLLYALSYCQFESSWLVG